MFCFTLSSIVILLGFKLMQSSFCILATFCCLSSCITYIAGGGLFEGGLFDDAPMGGEVTSVDTGADLRSGGVDQGGLDAVPHPDSDDDDHFGGPPSLGGHR